MPFAVIRGAGKKNYHKRSKHASRRKYMIKRGGAVYSFDLGDKIGGQAARMSLYKTTDSDCPPGGINDSSLGYDYYDPVKSQSGGTPKTIIGTGNSKSVQRGSGCGCNRGSTRTLKNNLETQRGGSRKYKRSQSKKHYKQSRRSYKH